MKKEIHLADLPEVVKEFLNNLKQTDKAIVVGLYGDLGAGKTTFTKELARQLGIEREITSPTFTVMQKYDISEKREVNSEKFFKNLIHIDLYRFESLEEIKVLKLEEIFSKKENLVLIEWADKMESDNFIKIKLNHVGEENKREIEIIYD